MSFCSTNGGVLAAVFICAIAVTTRCQDASDDLAMLIEVTEATPNNFSEIPSDIENFLAVHAARNTEARILNGSFCQRAFTCHPNPDPKAASIILGCSCHDFCAIFGDCCLDKVSILPPSEPASLPRASYTCAPKTYFTRSVYMINSCPASYEDESIADNCEKFSDFSASSMDIRWTPVTDVVTGATFRNIYCAMCWGKTWQNVTTWIWKFTCPEVHQESNQKQTESFNSWADVTGDTAVFRKRSVTSYVRSSCDLKYDPPALNTSLQFCKEGIISDCGLASSTAADTFDDELMSACQRGPARYVYDEHGSTYWNADCARCRRWPDEPDLSCQPNFGLRGVGHPSVSLSIILTPNSGDCTTADGGLSSSDGWMLEALCQGVLGCLQPGDGGWTRGCHSEPSGGRAFMSGPVGRAFDSSAGDSLSSCSFTDRPLSAAAAAKAQNAAWLNASADDGSATLTITLSDNATLCFRCAVERYNNFTVANGSLVVASSDGTSLQSFDYPMYTVEGEVATVCRALLSHGESAVSGDDGCTAVPAFVSALFMCLSEAGLAVFFAAFARAPGLRRFPGEMVLNESVAFFLAFLFFLARPLVGSLPAACTALSVLVHYFFLVAFAWTALYSTEIARALRFRVSQGVSKRRRASYYLIAYGAPLVCVALGLGADARALAFRPLYGPPQCFIGSRLGNLTLFIAPLCVFLAVDIVVYIFIIAKLVIIARQTKSVRSSHREKLWLSVKLMFSLGILWLFALLASFTQSPSLYCVFSLLNALQGVFVFAVFVCKRNVLTALGRKSKSSMMASATMSSRTTSTTSTIST